MPNNYDKHDLEERLNQLELALATMRMDLVQARAETVQEGFKVRYEIVESEIPKSASSCLRETWVQADALLCVKVAAPAMLGDVVCEPPHSQNPESFKLWPQRRVLIIRAPKMFRLLEQIAGVQIISGIEANVLHTSPSALATLVDLKIEAAQLIAQIKKELTKNAN